MKNASIIVRKNTFKFHYTSKLNLFYHGDVSKEQNRRSWVFRFCRFCRSIFIFVFFFVLFRLFKRILPLLAFLINSERGCDSRNVKNQPFFLFFELLFELISVNSNSAYRFVILKSFFDLICKMSIQWFHDMYLIRFTRSRLSQVLSPLYSRFFQGLLLALSVLQNIHFQLQLFPFQAIQDRVFARLQFFAFCR